MYNKFCRLVGAICLYLWLAHYFKTHYIVAGILVFSLLIFIIIYFLPNRKRNKQNKLNAQIAKKFELMKNSELIFYRKCLPSFREGNIAEIYDKERMRRFGFIERK